MMPVTQVTSQAVFDSSYGYPAPVAPTPSRPPRSDDSTTPPPPTPSDHERDASAPAPGDLELVRAFVSLHDHAPGDPRSLAPSPASAAAWLRSHGSLEEDPTDADLAWTLQVLADLRSLVFENMGAPADPAAARRLDAAARAAGLRPAFGDDTPLRITTTGARGVVGRLLATAFLARLDGSWRRLRECGDPDCTSVFYDRSKNRSTKWCSMATCGNRNKVRRFRERERAAARAPQGAPR